MILMMRYLFDLTDYKHDKTFDNSENTFKSIYSAQ